MIPNRIHTLLLDEIIIKTNIDFAIVRQSHLLFHFGLGFHRKNVFYLLLWFLPFPSMSISHSAERPNGAGERKKSNHTVVVRLFETKYRFVFICCRIRYMDTDGGMLPIFEWQRGKTAKRRWRRKLIKS